MVVKFLKDLARSVLEDKHSIGTSPDNGLHIYFSASFHFEFNANPSCVNQSLLLNIDFACNAATQKEKHSSFVLNFVLIQYNNLIAR